MEWMGHMGAPLILETAKRVYGGWCKLEWGGCGDGCRPLLFMYYIVKTVEGVGLWIVGTQIEPDKGERGRGGNVK